MKATILADVKKSLTPSNSLTVWATPDERDKNFSSCDVILLKSKSQIVFSILEPAISIKCALNSLTIKSKIMTIAIPIVNAINVVIALFGITLS